MLAALRLLRNLLYALEKCQNIIPLQIKLGLTTRLELKCLSMYISCIPIPISSLKNLGYSIDEQGERLHEDLAKIEKRCQGFWDEGMDPKIYN